MNSHDDLADAIISLVYRILGRHDVPVAKVFSGVWQNVNAGDPLLSDIILTVANSPVKGVPKLTSSSFSAGDPILVIKGPGVPYTILGKLLGDVTLVA